MKKSNQIPNKFLYFPVISLFIYFIFRLIDQSKLITTFPLDYTNDFSAHIAQLHFLEVCGFHKLCSFWYGGYTLFKFYPPGWFFYSFPIMKLFGSSQVATFVSLIFLFAICFFIIWFFGKKEKFNFIQILAFFVFFFGNAIAIGNFIRLGRVTEFFGWFGFLGLTFMALYYKDRPLDWRFIFFGIFYGLTIIGHFTVAVLVQFVVLGLFLSKKERIYVLLCAFFGAVLTSFWWLPFILEFKNSSISSYRIAERLWDFSGPWLATNIIGLIIVSIFFVLFWFYWKTNKKSKRDFLFFSPILFVAILFLFRLTPFIPLLNNVYPDPHITFFLFFILYFFFKINFNLFPKYIKFLILISLFLMPVLSIGVNHYHTPYFIENGEFNGKVLDVAQNIKGPFLMYGFHEETTYKRAYYSYLPILYNVTTPFGWADHGVPKEKYLNLIELENSFENRDCTQFLLGLEKTGGEDILSYREGCSFLRDCGLNEIIKRGEICLYRK